MFMVYVKNGDFFFYDIVVDSSWQLICIGQCEFVFFFILDDRQIIFIVDCNFYVWYLQEQWIEQFIYFEKGSGGSSGFMDVQ